MESGDVGGYVTIALGAVIIVVVALISVGVMAMIKAVAAKNNGFITRSSLVAQEMPPGMLVSARVQPVPGRPHAVWLDVSLSGPSEMGFELWLAVKIGPHALIEGNFPVTFDDEQDARGLPNAPGTSALNTISSGGFRGMTVTSILRAFRFDAPPMPLSGEVHARITPFPGTSFTKSRLILTVGDSPF